MDDVDRVLALVRMEVRRQDEKHGAFEGSVLGRSRLAVACVEDEVAELLDAWRIERHAPEWDEAADEAVQVAAVAVRALRDAFLMPKLGIDDRASNIIH